MLGSTERCAASPQPQLTLTIGVINHASVILFLVTGPNKAHILKRVIERQRTDPIVYPAESIQPEGGRLLWYLDQAAAAELSTSVHDCPSR